jgi:hypothetical protein
MPYLLGVIGYNVDAVNYSFRYWGYAMGCGTDTDIFLLHLLYIWVLSL